MGNESYLASQQTPPFQSELLSLKRTMTTLPFSVFPCALIPEVSDIALARTMLTPSLGATSSFALPPRLASIVTLPNFRRPKESYALIVHFG